MSEESKVDLRLVFLILSLFAAGTGLIALYFGWMIGFSQICLAGVFMVLRYIAGKKPPEIVVPPAT